MAVKCLGRALIPACGTQTIPIYITVSLVVLRLSIYTSQSPWWYSTIPLHISVSFLMLRLSLYTSQSPFWDSDYPLYSAQSPWWLRLSLYSSNSTWWYSDYPFTQHSHPGGTHTIPFLITVSLVVLGLSL